MRVGRRPVKQRNDILCRPFRCALEKKGDFGRKPDTGQFTETAIGMNELLKTCPYVIGHLTAVLSLRQLLEKDFRKPAPRGVERVG